MRAIEHINNVRNASNSIQTLLNVSASDIEEKIKALIKENKDLKKAGNNSNQHAVIHSESHDFGDWKLIVEQVEVTNIKDMRVIVDSHKNTNEKVCVVVLSVNKNKVAFVAGVTKNLIESISAKDVVSLLSDEIGGRGGGREDFAQGAGETKNIQEFVTSIANSVKSLAK
jgi:alanyl-tRNA synthetase